MANLVLPYAVVALILLGIAIYEHTNASALFLPLSPASTIPTILLPILSFLNTLYFSSRSSQRRHTQSSSASATTPYPLLPAALQLVQTVATTSLGTSFLSATLPSDTNTCALSTRWQRFWQGHDAAAIRRVQDALDCCGFNSPKDRAWPFPNKNHPDAGGCAAHFGRTASCAVPWARAMRTAGGVEFGVVAAVGVMQIITLLLLRYTTSSQRQQRNGALNIGWVSSAIKRLAGSGDDNDRTNRPSLHRPLLENGSSSFNGDDANHPRAVRDTNDDDEGDEHAHPQRQERGTTNGYGGTRTGPGGGARVEPSHLEASPWRDEEGVREEE